MPLCGGIVSEPTEQLRRNSYSEPGEAVTATLGKLASPEVASTSVTPPCTTTDAFTACIVHRVTGKCAVMGAPPQAPAIAAVVSNGTDVCVDM